MARTRRRLTVWALVKVVSWSMSTLALFCTSDLGHAVPELKELRASMECWKVLSRSCCLADVMFMI